MSSTKSQQEIWEAAMRAKGHAPVMENGVLDYFVMDEGNHNGPGCQTCGWMCCWHCEYPESIPDCTARAVNND